MKVLNTRLVGALALCLALPGIAHAHVKWFGEYDVSLPPKAISLVFGDLLFLALLALSFLAVLAVAVLDIRISPIAATRALDKTGQKYVRPFIRMAVALFFLALQITDMNVILTPELKSHTWVVDVLQYAVALFALFNATAFLAGLGIIALYLLAVGHCGLFHLLDYTIFLGIAGFLMIESLFRGKYIKISLLVLRITASFTLLWGAIEKFAYPDGFYRLLAQYPYLAFGFDHKFFLLAAGFVEFVCAYFILFGRLASKIACVILLGFFLLAIIPFGMVDAIGHFLFAVPLVALLATRHEFDTAVRPRHNLAIFAMTIPVMFASYYASQFLFT